LQKDQFEFLKRAHNTLSIGQEEIKRQSKKLELGQKLLEFNQDLMNNKLVKIDNDLIELKNDQKILKWNQDNILSQTEILQNGQINI